MGKVIVALTASLDGYIAGPNDGMQHPLGEGGERLFTWMGAGPERNRIDEYLCPPDASMPVVRAWLDDCGAGVSGRRTFDIVNGWADGHPLDVPNVILTHHPPAEGRWHPKVEFSSDLDDALARAQAHAGDLDVSVSAAAVAQQYLARGLVDEIEVSVAACLLGGGVRLFDAIGPVDLVQEWAIPSDGVTHLRYRVVRASGAG